MLKTTKAKAIVAAIGGLCTALAPVFADDVLDFSEIGQVIAALAAAAVTVWGVFQVRNKPKA